MINNHYQVSSTDADLLPICDENDVVIGSGTRRHVHLNGLRHRAVHVVVIDGRGNALLQLRSMKKDSHPGWWDISVGGHVDCGEEYEDAVARELREELGITGTAREVARRAPAEENGFEFVRIYECIHEGPFSPNTQEIDGVRWVNTAELLRDGRPDHPDHALRITRSGLDSIRAWASAVGLAG